MATRKPIALVSGYFQEVNTPTDKLDFAGNTTTDLAEGTNLYYTDAKARGSITIANSGTGYGSLGYVSSTGVLTYTVVTDANIRGSLSVASGSGLTYSSSTGQFGTSSIPNSQLAFSSVTVGSTSIPLGGTATTIAGLTAVTSTAFNVGTAGAANSITLDSTGIVFEGSISDTFETTLSVVNPTADQAINLPNASGTVALLTSLTGGNTGTGYGSLSYNNTTGAFTYSVVTDANIRGAVTAANSGTGYGSLAYSSATGTYTYTVVTDANIRGAVSVTAGSGLTYNSSTGAFSTSAIPNSQLANSSVTLGSTSVALGSTATSIAGLTAITATTVTAGTGGHVFTGATSGTTTVAASATASGTLTLPAATDTLIGKATSDTLTNKTFDTAGTGNVFRINGTQITAVTGTGSNVLSTLPTFGATGVNFSGSTSGTTTVLASATASGTLTLPATTSTVAVLSLVQSFSAAQRGAVSVLTDGATITPDFAASNNFSLTIGGVRTLANPSNQTAGQTGTIVITQDGTGGRTLAYGSNYKFVGGTVPTLTSTANAVDTLVYYVESASRITCRLLNDVK
jgi:predicted alpha/beta hydrolase family esterase